MATTLPIAGITALRTLWLEPDLLGRRVLVTGGSGAVGRFQVELASIQGAQVTAVASAQYADSLRSLGAVAVVPDTSALDGLFDLVTESIGGASLAAAISHSRPGSTIVVFGASGEPTSITLYDFVGHEGVAVRVFMSYASGEPFGPRPPAARRPDRGRPPASARRPQRPVDTDHHDPCRPPRPPRARQGRPHARPGRRGRSRSSTGR